MMVRGILVTAALLALGTPAWAQLPPLLPPLLPSPISPPVAIPAPVQGPTVYTQSGNVTFGSNGSTAIRSGNNTFISGPDGQQHVCQTIGAQTFCN